MAHPIDSLDTGAQTGALRGRKKSTTVFDVARRAVVSNTTVSRVINGAPSVSDATRSKVQAAIRELSYVPHPSARSLVGVKPVCIGVLLRCSRAAYPSQFLIGLMNSASQRGIRLVTELCEAPGREEATADALIDRGVEGIMLPPPFCDSAQLVQMLAQRSIPTVVLSSSLPHAPASAVGIDDYRAALEMTRHVLSLGHERIGFICGDPARTISARRLAGYKAAMAEVGIGTIVAQGMDTYRSGLDGAEALLSLDPRLSAIFASNDEMAAAAVACVNRLGLDVPSDITVVGFDDAALAMTIWPELTTVHQPILEMAMDGMDVLLRGIRALRSGEVPVKESLLKAHTLIRRRSDAAPRRRPPLRLSNAALNPANRTNTAPE